MSKKKALVTGVTGQDGSYIVELLLSKGYEVHGIKRRSSTFNTERLDHIYIDPHISKSDFFLYYGDLTESSNIIRILKQVEPDEIYNLAAQSHVRVSFETPEYTAQVDALGALRLLEGIRLLDMVKTVKYYQASTSELYGKVQETPQTEKTPFYPRSPYAVAKLFAYWITVNYREAYNIFGCNGILFNHESPRRGATFVTKKITRAVARIRFGLQGGLFLGNLDTKRDWGYAPEFVEAMWLILQQDEPDDYVISTGKVYSVRYFAQQAFKKIDIDICWEGKGLNETGINKKTGEVLVRIDPRYFRPAEVEVLTGDSSKAKEKLGWKHKINLDEMIDLMLEYDLHEAEKEKYLKDGGFSTVWQVSE